MPGLLDKAIEDAICQVEGKFNAKHTEILTKFKGLDERLARIEGLLQKLVNQK